MTYSYKQLCSLLVCLSLTCSTFGETIFVKANATGENDGESWENAFTNLTDALEEADEADQVWVAAGTYYPTLDTNRSASFIIPNGVEILGGFPNVGNPEIGNRNPSTNLTILSGDIDQDGNLANNSYTIIYTKNVDASTILDGFTITGGNADGDVTNSFPVLLENGGAAWYNEAINFENSNPTIKQCIFSNNFAANRGGAMYHRADNEGHTNYSLINCIFQNNTAERAGGAIFNTQSNIGAECSPTVSSTNFLSNTAGESGGAIFNNGAYFGVASGTYTNCNFSNNEATNNNGGAIFNNATFQGITNPTFTNCNFTGNNAPPGSGGAIYSDASGQGVANFRLTNCVFDQNTSSVYGGALCNIISNQGEIRPIYTNCIFKENTSAFGGATYSRGVFGSNLEVIIANSVFYKNQASVGGTIYQNETGETSLVTTKISNSIFEQNLAGFSPVFHLTGPSSISVNHSIFDVTNCLDLVEGGGSSEADCNGNNIFNQDSLFVDPNNGDFNISANSPAVNAGNNADISPFVTEDLAGNPRITGGTIDIGVYEEVNANSDNDEDGILDIDDNCPLVANAGQEDIDGDGAGTVCDCDDSIATGSSCSTGCSVFYLDNDNDGFGNPVISTTTCVVPVGYVTNNQDFNDNDPTLYPNAPELCDEKDNNNNGQIDEGTDDDNDGVCNDDDICPDGDDNIDDNNNGIPDACESQITLNCPSDITISAAIGQNSATVSWDEPIVTTDCNGGGSGDGSCTGTPISGFTYKGEHNGSDYYLSDIAAIWTTGQSIAQTNGANLVIINDQAENDFVKSIIGSNIIHIGVTDQATEGIFNWVDGTNTDAYSNFRGIPGAADYGIMYFWNGKWAVDGNYTKQYLIEKACSSGSGGGLMINQTAGFNNGASFPVGTTPVTYTATDDCGGMKTCTFNVTVEATSSTISINCPSNITINAAPGATDAVATWNELVTSSDCTGSVTATPSIANGTAFPIGTTTVTYTAADNCGSTATCQFTVTVNATNSDISITCPADITINAAPGATEAIATWNEPITASNCAGLVTATPSIVSGTAFPIGTTSVTYTAADNCEGTATCQFTVTVNATNSDISITCPANITINAAPEATEAIATWNEPVTASNCAGLVTATPSIVSGTAFPIGTTSVTYTAADDCGSTATCQFTVTVNATSSNISITCPTDIIVIADSGATSKIVTWSNPITSSDCPTGTINVTASITSGTAFQTGTTTPVTLTATDSCGETISCTFNVTVNEGASIVNLTCPTDIIIQAGAGETSKIVTYQNPIGTTTCSTSGVALERLNGFASGASFPLGTTIVEYKGMDNCESMATCTFNVTVNATEIQLNCPADIIESVSTGTVAVAWPNPTGGSNCSAGGYTFTQTEGPASGSQFAVGNTTITYTATDNCGSSITCSFTVTVNQSNSNLSLTCPADINISVPQGAGGGIVNWSLPTAITNCVLEGDGLPTCAGATIAGFDYKGTYNGSDYYLSQGRAPWLTAMANSAIAGGTLVGIEDALENDFIETIVGGEIVHIGRNDMTTEGTEEWLNGESIAYNNFSGSTPNNAENDYTLFYPWNGTWDWVNNGTWKSYLMEIKCGGSGISIPTITQTNGPANGASFPVGSTIVTYQATDDCGNLTTCSFNVTVTETVVVCNPDNSGGQISGNEIVCDPYDPQTITSSNLPTGGSGAIEYMWLKSESGCPTNISQAIPNSNSPTYNPPFITTTTSYVRWSRRANCNDWVASNCITKTVDDCGMTTNYCDLSAQQPWQEWISRVEVADLDKTSGKSLGYSDYTNLVANLTAGQEYTVNVSLTFSYNQWDETVYVWMDFNQDNDFNDPGELVVEQLSPSNGSGGAQPDVIVGGFTVPANAVPGTTRMRVAMKREFSINPCGDFTHGEVEDYSLNIAAGASNSATPALTFDAYPVTGTSILEWISNTTDLEANFEIERSTDNQQFEKIEEIEVIYEGDYDSFYRIIDEQPELGTNYYRIKQTFKTGETVYTNTKKIVYGTEQAKLHFYPNPAADVLYIETRNYQGKQGTIQIINMLGQVLENIELETIHDAVLQIPLDQLDNGMHSLLVKVKGNRIQTELFIVEKMR